MSGPGEILFFCLATGAAMGCLFLLFQALEILLHAGKWTVAVLDFLSCCLCAMIVFLCALAVEKGRLRLFQVLLQLLGGWAAVQALGGFTAGFARRLRKILCRIIAFFQKKWGILAAHFPKKPVKKRKKRKKTGKKPKKPQKRGLKNLCRPVYNNKVSSSSQGKPVSQAKEAARCRKSKRKSTRASSP